MEKAIHYISQRVVAHRHSCQSRFGRRTASTSSARGLVTAAGGVRAPLVSWPIPSRCWDFLSCHTQPREPLHAESRLNGLVSVWGNQYSVPPGVIGTQVTIRWRLGDPTIDMVSESGRLVATHRKVPRGQGRTARLPEHIEALENIVLAEFTTKRPCKPKPNRPPTEAALAVAAGVGGDLNTETVIDLGVYQRHIDRQNRGRR